MPTMEELKQQYADEWLAVEVTREEQGWPLEGVLIAHEQDRQKLWEHVRPSKNKLICILYSGPVLPEGWGAAF